MNKFDAVKKDFDELPYMKHNQASMLRELIREVDAKEILEIGFSRGKSSVYIAAILEDQRAGNLTTLDRKSAQKNQPNITEVLDKIGVSHRVTPIYCYRSYTWELQKLINSPNCPKFDLCYFDGGHTWDDTGFGVVLVDRLLRPGGTLILNELDWSIARSPYYKRNPRNKALYSKDEQEATPVRLVWNTILPQLGYKKIREHKDLRWGIARKRPPGDQVDNAFDAKPGIKFSLFGTGGGGK